MPESNQSMSSPMSNDSAPVLLKIYEELVAIRELLARPPAAAAAPARAAAYSAGQSAGSGTQAEIPQPSKIIDNPGDIQVHFGKNNGVALSALSERSLSWYATEQPPRLDSSGKPYPPRPQEVTLRNAARQLWHQQKGTLAGSENPTGRPAENHDSSGAGAASTEEVPFAARYYEHG